MNVDSVKNGLKGNNWITDLLITMKMWSLYQNITWYAVHAIVSWHIHKQFQTIFVRFKASMKMKQNIPIIIKTKLIHKMQSMAYKKKTIEKIEFILGTYTT